MLSLVDCFLAWAASAFPTDFCRHTNEVMRWVRVRVIMPYLANLPR